MAVGNNNQIEKRLWDAADELRANSKLKSSEYSIPVLGLIFLRYADQKFAAAQVKQIGVYFVGIINNIIETLVSGFEGTLLKV